MGSGHVMMSRDAWLLLVTCAAGGWLLCSLLALALLWEIEGRRRDK